jgi:hypothetical protein
MSLRRILERATRLLLGPRAVTLAHEFVRADRNECADSVVKKLKQFRCKPKRLTETLKMNSYRVVRQKLSKDLHMTYGRLSPAVDYAAQICERPRTCEGRVPDSDIVSKAERNLRHLGSSYYVV